MTTDPKPTSLRAIFNEIRGIYVAHFQMLLTSLKGKELITESAFRGSDGRFTVGEEGDLPLRMDIAVIDADGEAEPLRVESSEMADFPPFGARLPDGVELIVAPFRWEGCLLLVEGMRSGESSLVKDWFWRWFDPDDTKEPEPESGLCGIIHFMSVESIEAVGRSGDRVPAESIQLDFGSAPVEALDDLLGCLVDAGARRIQLSALAPQ